jgi:hypothetical protein
VNVILLTTFRASRKDPLGGVLARIHTAFHESGLGEPHVAFAFADSPLGSTSSVDRVLKRHPDLQRFVSTHAPMPALPPVRQISNDGQSPARGEAVAFATLLAIAGGVPRSFPFHNIAIHFQSPAFGVGLPASPLMPHGPGVIVGDSWWVNGRTRSVSAISSVEVETSAKKLPPHPPAVAAVLAACGKAQKTVQIPLAGEGPTLPQAAMAAPDVTRQVNEVVRDYRARLPEIIARAQLPHDLPPAIEALKVVSIGERSGPKKPALVAAFSPLGYGCRGDSGTFTLRRRTPANLTVSINLDVGTWSNSLTAFYEVSGLGFRTLLPLPASVRAGSGQYPIGGPDRWKQIVENLAALVTELDRTFVPAVEAASGPAPEWYKPEE